MLGLDLDRTLGADKSAERIGALSHETDRRWGTAVRARDMELDSALEGLKELMGNRADPQANVIGAFSAG